MRSMTLLVASFLITGLVVDCVHSASPTKRQLCTEEVLAQPRLSCNIQVATLTEGAIEKYLANQVPQIVEQVVAAESKGESLEGQMAVAQTIVETAEYYGLSYEEVATGGKYTSPDPYDEVSDSVKEACHRVICLGERVTEEPIMWFYSTAGGFYSKWHETSPNLEYVITIGAHKFFALKEA